MRPPNLVNQVVAQCATQPGHQLGSGTVRQAIARLVGFQQGELHDAGKVHLRDDAPIDARADQERKIRTELLKVIDSTWRPRGHSIRNSQQQAEGRGTPTPISRERDAANTIILRGCLFFKCETR
jgi:hypothetical protein